jgi:hypothetical protein
MCHSQFLILVAALLTVGCDLYTPTMKPDYTINVVPTAAGAVAVAPTCPSWAENTLNPYDNQPLPQFGCASARNLAMMAERPEDLVKGRELGPTRGVPLVGAIRRYDNNQTRGLIFPSSQPDTVVDVTTASTPASTMTGDVTGSASSSGSSSSGSSSGATSTGSSSSSGP